ncbi:4-carboxy-4-hydroxy-2-oxoadipate aldolase/oxaloacetate decarboxylase [Mycobacterium intracellulare]|uniref:4-carboxy-4-hydroxy-2-oxoadipate aldolase/oxaloacetate decarboxylase n=1 Tax=Mycobacterium intracellulare TaxID=1767 RepID=UPI0033634C1D
MELSRIGVAVREIERPCPDLVAALGEFGVATIHEAQQRTGLLSADLSPIYRGAHIAGAAVTISVPPADNWMIHVAIELCQPGDVLVVAPTSPSDAGYFGELLATSAQVRGIRGLIIEAGCRDVAELTEMGFPVWSKHICATGTVKERLGNVNRPLVCAGQLIHPGDVVVADDDGVVVVARSLAAAVMESAQQRSAREAVSRERYGRGELSLDVHGMRQRLADKGLIYVDSPEELS